MSDQDPMKPPPLVSIPGLPSRRSWIARVLGHPRLLLLALPLLALAALVPAGALARYTTSNSDFCLTCHGVGDTPDRSVRSLVHPDFSEVGCVDCHSKPGQVVYEGYVHGFMAEPERVSPNCERCHSQMTARNDTEGFEFNFASITIEHEKHLERGATCVTCHANVAHDLRTPATNRPRMDTCYSCHATTETCTKCHEGAIPAGQPPFAASAAGDAQVDGRLWYQRTCSGCHGTDGAKVSQANLASADALQNAESGRWRTSVAEGIGAMPPMARKQGGPLTDEQITSVLAYLELQARAASAAPGEPEDLYGQFCLSCHGSDGGKMPAASFNQASFWEGKGDEQVRSVISSGWGGMPGFGPRAGGKMTPTEIEAVTRYIRGFAQTAEKVDTAQGEALYAAKCAACHGPDGSALPSSNLGDTAALQARGADDLVAATRDGRGGMPAMGGQLSDEEIASIVNYLLNR